MRVFILALLVAGCSESTVEGVVATLDVRVEAGVDAASDVTTDARLDVDLDTQQRPNDATIGNDSPQDAPGEVLETGTDSPTDAPIDGPSCECGGTVTQLHAQVVTQAQPGETVSATAACDGEVRVYLGATCYSGCTGTTADTCWQEVPIVESDDGTTFSCSFPYDSHGTHNVMQYYCNSCVKWKEPCS